jgi:hypothetical protein
MNYLIYNMVTDESHKRSYDSFRMYVPILYIRLPEEESSSFRNVVTIVWCVFRRWKKSFDLLAVRYDRCIVQLYYVIICSAKDTVKVKELESNSVYVTAYNNRQEKYSVVFSCRRVFLDNTQIT